MNYTKLGWRGDKMTLRTLTDESLLALFKAESIRTLLEKYRENTRPLAQSRAPKLLQRMPQLVFGGTLQRKDEKLVMQQYNGCVLLEISHLSYAEEAAELRDRIAAYPQTRWAFVGADRRSVYFVVPYTRPDGTLPQDEAEVKLFHAQAFRHAVKTYEPRLSYPIEIYEQNPVKSCLLSDDAQVYYNADALPIHLEQPTEWLAETDFQEKPSHPERLKNSGEVWYEERRYISTQFELALQRAIDLHGKSDIRLDFKPLIHSLGVDCFGAGIPEEDCVKWTLLYFGELLGEVEIRETLHNTYKVKKGFGEQPLQKFDQVQALLTDEFMHRRYEFRRNTMSGAPEYRERGTFCFEFRPITNEVYNSIALDAQLEGLQLWDRDVHRYINSNRVKEFSPIDDYLQHLPKWDGNDYIRSLADRVKCDNPQWRDLFYRWFLGMVAYWQQRDTKHANSTSPLLVGPQGIDKSTFCRSILPTELSLYFTDDLDFSEKRHAMLYLNRFALINLDEFDQIGVRHQGFLKHLLQKPSLNVRRPNSAYIEKVRRYASFIATSNHEDLLNDPSGSRRFICVHVSDIDNSQPIDYGQLYAQAVAALDAGERYWFTREEGEQQTESNREFQQMPVHEQLFHQYYRGADEDEEGVWLAAVAIFQELQKKSRIKLAVGSISMFGRFLAKQGFLTKRTKYGTLYKLVLREEK